MKKSFLLLLRDLFCYYVFHQMMFMLKVGKVENIQEHLKLMNHLQNAISILIISIRFCIFMIRDLITIILPSVLIFL